MKKKRGLLILVGMACLLSLFVTSAAAQVIKLTLADQNPQTGWVVSRPFSRGLRSRGGYERQSKNRCLLLPDIGKSTDIWNAVRRALQIWAGVSMDIGPT